VYLSFEEWDHIPKENFEWIEEWHAHETRKYLIGVIHVSHLKDKTWWKEQNISLILAPQPIIEEVELKKIQKKSLELAGVS
jgi:homoserine dehydrogenase